MRRASWFLSRDGGAIQGDEGWGGWGGVAAVEAVLRARAKLTMRRFRELYFA